MRNLETIWNLWQTAQILPTKTGVATMAARFIMDNRVRYSKVGDQLNIPFYIIGSIHYRESSFDFNTHLANGDKLFDTNGMPLKTTHVPAGLGPYPTWEAAAIGALEHRGWGLKGWHWDIVNALENVELYNGLGYYNQGHTSPYVWAGTNQYTKGLYVADGQYDPDKVDPRVGCGAIFLALKPYAFSLNEIQPA